MMKKKNYNAQSYDFLPSHLSFRSAIDDWIFISLFDTVMRILYINKENIPK